MKNRGATKKEHIIIFIFFGRFFNKKIDFFFFKKLSIFKILRLWCTIGKWPPPPPSTFFARKYFFMGWYACAAGGIRYSRSWIKFLHRKFNLRVWGEIFTKIIGVTTKLFFYRITCATSRPLKQTSQPLSYQSVTRVRFQWSGIYPVRLYGTSYQVWLAGGPGRGQILIYSSSGEGAAVKSQVRETKSFVCFTLFVHFHLS